MRRAVSRFMPKARPTKLPSDVGTGTGTGAGAYRLDHGSVDEFYIALDDPHKSWSPGEEISGQVILRSKKNLANIAIKFNLSGCVKIHASPHSKLRPMKTVLFSHTMQIYGPSGNHQRGQSAQDVQAFTNGLYKGEHRFPFIVKLPNKRVFTSIDFGKGAIMYVLSAHLVPADAPQSPTNQNNSSSLGVGVDVGTDSPGADAGEPFSLARARAREALAKIHHPTYSDEKIISLVNPVDVAFLPAPKRKRLIIKNPHKDPRKSKGKLSRVQSSTSTVNTLGTIGTVGSANSDADSSVGASCGGMQTQAQTHASHGTAGGCSSSSELHRAVSRASRESTSTPPAASPNTTNAASTSAFVQVAKPADTIRVSMDVAQRGFLRGELIPIKLSINHLRKIQDSSGIIVTLVRVCRIDYGPDGYYESFRKDLQQHVIPLFVDPATFSSEISTSVRVPPDAFPTISGCPLVSFQYFIEVMLNLSGKSLGLAAHNEQPKSAPNEHDAPSPQAPAASYNFHSLAHSRSEYINTDKFKRSKKFLQMTTEVVIGTHRSVRPAETTTRGSSASLSDPHASPSSLSYAASQSHSHSHSQSRSQSQSLSGSVSQNQSPSAVASVSNGLSAPINAVPELFPMDNFDSPPYLPSPILPEAGLPGGSDSAAMHQDVPRYVDVAVSSPPQPEQRALSEKERMRQHETSLLPSAPPLDDDDDDDEEDEDEDENDEEDINDDDTNGHGNEDSDNIMSADPPNTSASAGGPEFDWNMDHPEAGNVPDDFGAGHDFMGDELYEAPGAADVPDIHEGIGSEGAKEYVPNYSAAANDRLVESTQEMN